MARRFSWFKVKQAFVFEIIHFESKLFSLVGVKRSLLLLLVRPEALKQQKA